MIPPEIESLRQWSYSFSEEELKRPTHTHYKHNGALSLQEAIQQAGESKYIGFYVTPEDPYVLIDIDHVANPNNPFGELPVPLASLLQSNNSYSEISPSGKGLRVIFKLPSAKDKDLVQGQIFYIKDGKSTKDFQINFGRPWMTITCNPTPFAVDSLAEIPLKSLAEVFDIPFKSEEGVKHITPSKKKVTSDLPPFNNIVEGLRHLALDQNPRIRRAYKEVFGHDYSHYDYWIKVLMAIFDYGENGNAAPEAFEAAVNWSSQDPEAFKSEEDVYKHWKSFREKDTKISYKSLLALAYHAVLRWPVPKKQSEKQRKLNIPAHPLTSEYSNFMALAKYYDLKLYRDETNVSSFFISGDADIIEKHFMMFRVSKHYNKYYGPFDKNTLIPVFHKFCQLMGFIGMGHGTVKGFVSNFMAETRDSINLIRLYFDTPFDKLPTQYQENINTYKTSTIEQVFDCLEIDFITDDHQKEYELYKKYYISWWMGLVRNMYFKDSIHANNCVLLLTGPEQIRKTSHFNMCLPSFMREQIAFTTHGFSNEASVRDVCKLSAMNIMIVWDELEQYLNGATESNFKKIIDNNPQKIIDKYEILATTINPIAIYGATSNIREFKLGQEGSRRLFHIPVSWVDTDKLLKINWHKVINDLKATVVDQLRRGNVPWLLDERQLEQQIILHSQIRSKNSIDIAFTEMFDMTESIADRSVIPHAKSMQSSKNNGALMSTREVILLLQMYGVPVQSLKRPAIVKSLERFCGDYTGTGRKGREFTTPKCYVKKGLAQQGPHKKWVMPPLFEYVREALSVTGVKI